MSVGERPVNSQSVMQQSMASITLRGAIKGLYHYYIKKNAVSNAPAKLLFSGTKNGFTGISISALNFSQQPARITVSENKDNMGIVNLVYCDYDNSAIYPSLNIKAECDNPRIIATNIKKSHFSYFGWSSINHLYSLTSTPNNLVNNKDWSIHWDASNRGILPQFIKIELEYYKGQATFQPTQLWFHISDADPVQFNVNVNNNE